MPVTFRSAIWCLLAFLGLPRLHQHRFSCFTFASLYYHRSFNIIVVVAILLESISFCHLACLCTNTTTYYHHTFVIVTFNFSANFTTASGFFDSANVRSVIPLCYSSFHGVHLASHSVPCENEYIGHVSRRRFFDHTVLFLLTMRSRLVIASECTISIVPFLILTRSYSVPVSNDQLTDMFKVHRAGR